MVVLNKSWESASCFTWREQWIDNTIYVEFKTPANVRLLKLREKSFADKYLNMVEREDLIEPLPQVRGAHSASNLDFR